MKEWISKNQVLTFYILVFAISWPCMIAIFNSSPENMPVQALCGIIATFSPVLIALLISTITKPQPKRDRSLSRWLVFLGGWMLSWGVLILHTWQIREAALDMSVIIPTAFVAILPGWLISCACSRIPGVRELFGTLLRPRGNVLWYLAAFLIVPAIQLLGAGITTLLGGSVESSVSDLSLGRVSVVIGVTFLNGFLISGGINEETGWRGFVLPRLQARYPVIVAVVIVWFFWALWHIPYDIGQDVPLESMLFNRIVLNFVWAVLAAWLYNRTNGSLLAPAIFHPAMNAFGDALPRTDTATILFLVLVVTVIIHDRMWEKLPSERLAVYSG